MFFLRYVYASRFSHVFRVHREAELTWCFGGSSRQPIRLVILGCAIVGVYLSLQAALLPFVWFWFTWFIALLYFGLTSGTSLSKAVWANMSAVLLALALGESLCMEQQNREDELVLL